jgi:cytoskeletal protein CcmA (bactofilin family)
MKHIIRLVALITLVTLLAGLTAFPVAAADLKTGETIRIAAGETVEGDLYFAGSSLNIEGTVNGDVFAVGQSITISGTVKGGVTLAGAQLNLVNAKIAGGARLAGTELSVSGTIGRDLMVGATRLNSAADVGGDLVLGVTQATISGSVKGALKGGGSDITLSGTVGRDVTLSSDRLTIGPTASLGGNLNYTSERTASIDSASKIKGLTNRHDPERNNGGWLDMGRAASNAPVGFVMIFLIGLIFVLALPRPTLALAGAIREQPLSGLGWGALVLFATPIAGVIVCFTVVGIPAGLITLALWGMGLYLAQIPAALALGRLVFRRPGVVTKSVLVGQLAIGLALITLAGIIPVLGNVVMGVSALFGLGALVVLCLQARKPKAAVPAVPAAPIPPQ